MAIALINLANGQHIAFIDLADLLIESSRSAAHVDLTAGYNNFIGSRFFAFGHIHDVPLGILPLCIKHLLGSNGAVQLFHQYALFCEPSGKGVLDFISVLIHAGGCFGKGCPYLLGFVSIKGVNLILHLSAIAV